LINKCLVTTRLLSLRVYGFGSHRAGNYPLFVRCKEDISHNPPESVEEDVDAAIEVVRNFVSQRVDAAVTSAGRRTHDRKGHAQVSDVKITAGPFDFIARWERERAPKTCEAFERLLPFRNKIIHVRWSGESAWIPLGDFDVGVGFENHTSYPAPGEILIYPGGYSETEILFPYGGTRFASIVGQLAGNHFLTITEGRENLRKLGEMVLWEGAQDILFDRA
jgi:uncharacterized protein DUF3830